jgi:prevent-host-death family protein
MRIINIHEAKTHLSRLVEDAMGGEEITIAKAGKPIAKLGPIEAASSPRQFGILKGKIKISADFDSELPKDILDDFGGN